MLSRRTFLQAASACGAAALGPNLVRAEEKTPNRKRLAVVTTVWRNRSHAWHMAERFLAGYPQQGSWHRPPLDVVSAYVDQQSVGDLSKQRAADSGFRVFPSIAEALRCGGSKLAVDAVLIIGEHGTYEKSEFGQTKYPRYEFFKQVTDVFRQEGRGLPVFNDKHLSWRWDWAREMVDLSRELEFPFLAGSSLPVTWRMPSIEMPYDAPVEEMMCVAFGGVDSYDFHALEVIQCMAERRQGGETGIARVQALRGDAVWKAMQSGPWDPSLFETCLCRSQTLSQVETYSHRYPTPEQLRAWVKDPVAYRIQYADGVRATMLLMNGLVQDFTFAARLKGRAELFSTLFYLPPVPNVTYSAGLMSKAEELFVTGRAPYPIERTLLTTGLLAAAVQSLGTNQQVVETPHLEFSYRAARESHFLQS